VRLTKLRARWIGHPPRAGDYLMSALRPRYAYRVERVTNSSSEVNWDPVAKTEVRRLLIEAARVAPAGIPKHARIHSWKWDTRVVRAGSVSK
jgi:hypothetical protein